MEEPLSCFRNCQAGQREVLVEEVQLQVSQGQVLEQMGQSQVFPGVPCSPPVHVSGFSSEASELESKTN